VLKAIRVQTEKKQDRPPKEEPDRTPDTPTDEPKPAPVQDPPAEPGRPPLVVTGGEMRTGAPAREQL